MEREEVKVLVAMNKSNYSYAYSKMTQEQTTALVDCWYMLFKDENASDVNSAYLRALKVCVHPITPADIFRELDGLELALMANPEEMWRSFLSAAKKANDLERKFNYSAESLKTPGITQGKEAIEECKIILNSLDPSIRSFVGNIHRLAQYGAMDSKEQEYLYHRFRANIEHVRKCNKTLENVSKITGAKEQKKIGSGWGENVEW